ncbi:MAG: cell division protein FtsZ [Rhodospirillaceae bacterium]|nr:cell division protein FtsZ [Rhodospirillaceae bacterium]
MTINLSVPNETLELKPRISVVGVGGAGGNAVNNMINGQLEGCEFIVANTDAQALIHSGTDRRIQLGANLTQGLGAGSKPDIGRAAAEETIDELNEQLKGAHMVFIAAGMGGGTGTGAAPVIARAARDAGILTVGVVTKPFQFEGQHRMRLAEKGIEELEQYVDTLIIIPNQNLFRIANEKTTFSDAFKMADDVLYSGVRSVTDLMVRPGLINLDFADVRSVMNEMGKAMMGTGEAEGERRALDAAEAAISNPLLDDASMAGANGVLINITGGSDMTLFEVDEAANRIRAEVDQDAYIIFGSTYEEGLDGRMRVSVVATGIDAENSRRQTPTVLGMEEAVGVSRPRVLGMEEAEVLAEVAIAEAASETPAPEINAEINDSDLLSAEDVAAAASELEMVEETSAEISSEAPMGAVEIEFVEEDITTEEMAPLPTPPAMPNAEAEDAFIPSAPAVINDSDEAATKKADPFAAAAMENGTQMDEGDLKRGVSRGPSLFERVTGSAKNTINGFVSPKSEPQAAEPEKSEAVPAPVAELAAVSEPTLGGMDSEERIQGSSTEDDLLDIPAFLRRQAN